MFCFAAGGGLKKGPVSPGTKVKEGRAALLGRSKAVPFGNSYFISSAAPKQQSKLHSLKVDVQN